jgi:hypothetical protein
MTPKASPLPLNQKKQYILAIIKKGEKQILVGLRVTSDIEE